MEEIVMKNFEVKVGDRVKAKFRKYGVHPIIGTVTEVSTDKHALEGVWVSIKISDGELNDQHVQWLIKNRIGVLIPIKDVVEIIKENHI